MHVALLLLTSGAFAGGAMGYALGRPNKVGLNVAVGSALGAVAGLFVATYLLFRL